MATVFCLMSEIGRTFEWYDDWSGKFSNKIVSLDKTIRVDGERIVRELVRLLNGTQLSFNRIRIDNEKCQMTVDFQF
jgi:hypothetical protein